MSVAITLNPVGNQSGGNVADTITSPDYADTDALATVLAAQTPATFVKITNQVNADGTTIVKKRLIPLASIKQIVTL